VDCLSFGSDPGQLALEHNDFYGAQQHRPAQSALVISLACEYVRWKHLVRALMAVFAISACSRAAHQVRTEIPRLDRFAQLTNPFHVAKWRVDADTCETIRRQLVSHMFRIGRGHGLPDSVKLVEERFTYVTRLDSSNDSRIPWSLELIVPRGHEAPATYFETADPCDLHWVGPWNAPDFFIATIKGRFLSWGNPFEAAAEDTTVGRLNGMVRDDESGTSHGSVVWLTPRGNQIDSAGEYTASGGERRLIDDDGRGARYGDTVMIYVAPPIPNPTDPAFLNRFNRSLSAINAPIEALGIERTIDLYLKCVYPTNTVLKLHDADEMDSYYLFFHSARYNSDESIDSSTWDLLLVPGAKDGTFLKGLPTRSDFPRPGKPLPSIVLETNDGGWFTHSGGHKADGEYSQTVTILTTWPTMLLELSFALDRGRQQIDEVRIQRIWDFSTHFYPYVLRE